ncbi:MAG: DUF4419 domain-containing protein [Deltaproteobacteria bacterium]|nr:DUF4419 domain-containing protein [Deltaproteobacteria bacterium]
MSVSFAVCDVSAPTTLLPTVDELDAIVARLAATVEAGAANLGGLVASRVHPFVHAAHLAFAHHFALTLSPDDVWLCIAQAFAHHVDANADALRDRFVRHADKTAIVVIRDEFRKGSPDNDWPGVFAQFSDAIAGHIGKQRDLVVAEFSTTGPIEKAASEVVLMSAMQAYFDYVVVTRCGIPRVTLLGSEADWRAIRSRAAVLAEYGLAPWIAALTPILDELCAAAGGRPDRELWRSFYKYESRSGGDRVSGWINVLFPYVRKEGSAQLEANPRSLSWRGDRGPAPAAFPSGLAIAPFTWLYLGTPLPMEMVAGFMGVSHDPQVAAVRPAIGWAIRDAAMAPR